MLRGVHRRSLLVTRWRRGRDASLTIIALSPREWAPGAPRVFRGRVRGVRPQHDGVDPGISTPAARSRPTALAVWLIIAGVIGWWAAFSLTMERLALLADPEAIPGCDVGPLVP